MILPTESPWTLAVLLVVVGACTTPSGQSGDLDAATPFDGAFLGPCSADDYLIIDASACPATGCIGTLAFALCEGTSYGQCACAPPGGAWTLVEGGPPDGRGDGRVEGGRDAGDAD